jgi:hypothetical protein
MMKKLKRAQADFYNSSYLTMIGTKKKKLAEDIKDNKMEELKVTENNYHTKSISSVHDTYIDNKFL